MLLCCGFSYISNAQIIVGNTPYKEGTRERAQIQNLLNTAVMYADNMLKKQGAYPPYAAALTYEDSVVMVNGYPGKQDQTLKYVIEDLKSALRAGVDKGIYKAVAVFYDVTINDPNNNNLPTDATAVYTEQVNINSSYTFYFPYKKMADKSYVHSMSFGTLSETEIFIKVKK